MRRSESIEFDKLQGKIKAREDLVKFYKASTGFKSIPDNYQYWTLCNVQSNEPDSEINQLIRLGLIKSEQYHGVDWNKENIEISKKNHPKAHFYYGEWKDVFLAESGSFSPAVVYLDTMYVGNSKNACKIASFTMMSCPPGTFLFVNVMLNNPYSGQGIMDSDFLKRLGGSLTPAIADMWDDRTSLYYKYTATGLTTMGTYILRRKGEL